MFVAYSYASKAGISGCLQAFLGLRSGSFWQISHKEMRVKTEQGIGNIRVAAIDKRCNVVNLLAVYIPWNEQRACYKQGHPRPLVNVSGSSSKIIYGPPVAHPAQG